ncbi:purine permease 2-like [Ipomoea triloba]|uniref:purine permease 2-like n=1 Tax=Ipomoea triloba TaxID=35885 RepID=UPI00125D9FDC|nr:purine permease 2-like [Ipomoea triloba]
MEASEGKGSMRRRRRLFLFLNYIMMCIGGNGGGPLLLRLYFIRGGDRICTTTTTTASFFTITQNIIFSAAALGVLLGRINYVYTYGVAKLPVSTSSLIVASQLAFTADTVFVLVKQRFTVTAVVLLTIRAEVLVVGSSGDRPAGESKKEYVAVSDGPCGGF